MRVKSACRSFSVFLYFEWIYSVNHAAGLMFIFLFSCSVVFSIYHCLQRLASVSDVRFIIRGSRGCLPTAALLGFILNPNGHICLHMKGGLFGVLEAVDCFALSCLVFARAAHFDQCSRQLDEAKWRSVWVSVPNASFDSCASSTRPAPSNKKMDWRHQRLIHWLLMTRVGPFCCGGAQPLEPYSFFLFTWNTNLASTKQIQVIMLLFVRVLPQD